MQDQLKILFDLQKLDDVIVGVEEEGNRIPKQIDQLKAKIVNLEALLTQKETGLKSLAKARKDKEQDLEQTELKIRNDNSKLMDVKTNKEYHALQKEIAGHSENLGLLEEEILLLMDEIEQFDVEVKRMKTRFNAQKGELDEQIGSLEERLAEVPVQLNQYLGVRAELTQSVDDDLIRRYEMTKKQRGGQAVAFIENALCMGCRLEIPPQTFNLIQRNEDIFTCPNCHRILYFPGKATVNQLDL